MKRDRCPLPLINEIFDEVRGSTVFITLKFFQKYCQIKMHESCKETRTFICRYETFQFEVMPFGLKNSGATFQRMMDNLLANVSNAKCYVDALVVHSAPMEENVEHLEKVMSLLRKRGFRVRLSKCFIMPSRVQLLGHGIDKYRVYIHEDKVKKTRDVQPLGEAKELRSFLGLASYYLRFIKGLAKIASPLSEKTSEKVDFEWTSEIQEAFETLKQALIAAPVLVFPGFAKPFIAGTDALKRAIGAVLSQKDENRRENSSY